MFVKVFSGYIEKKTASSLINLRNLLAVEQKGDIITYTYTNNVVHSKYFPSEVAASSSIKVIEKVPVQTIKNDRWDMPEPDIWAMEMIQYYEDSTNTERLR